MQNKQNNVEEYRLYLHMAVQNTGKPFENMQKYTKQCGGIRLFLHWTVQNTENYLNICKIHKNNV